jgi:hypothetical protein
MKNHLRKTTSGWILLTVVLPWLLTRSGLAADKFKVILIGREETATLERQHDQFSEITSVDADEEGHIYVLDGREAVVKVFDATGMFCASFSGQGRDRRKSRIPSR